MSELIAKPVVKNKFWVVEDQGEKIATIQARHDGGFVYVHDDQREYFDTFNILKKKYKIKFTTPSKIKINQTTNVYGFPIQGKAYNQIWDVQKKVGLYTKLKKSKSFFCAGFFLIKINSVWKEVFCPKNITLNRYEYLGPFKNETEITTAKKNL